MAAAIRTNKGTLTNGSRSNSVLPAPSTIVNGDILLAILIVGNSAAPSVTPPAGFAEITGYPIVYGNTIPGMSISMHLLRSHPVKAAITHSPHNGLFRGHHLRH